MFTGDHREALRRFLLGRAERDRRITGAAVTGSAADGREDRWSDVDLYFGVAEGAEVETQFRVAFGEAVQVPPAAGLDPGHAIGLGWHHVLHARTSIERGQPWQAEYWISGIRDRVLALASRRHGEPTAYAKGADALPATATAGLEDALVRSLASDDLRRALRAAATAFLVELHELRELHGTHGTEPVQVERLEGPIRELADLPAGPPPADRGR